MFGSREYADQSAEHQLEAPLRVLWRKLRNRRLSSDDQLQLGYEVEHQSAVRVQRGAKCGAPHGQFGFSLLARSGLMMLRNA